MASVSDSGAGPPLAQLNLTPQSPSGPPGLWLAVRMKPPYVFRALKDTICSKLRHRQDTEECDCYGTDAGGSPSTHLMTADAAGVHSNPSLPTITFDTPFAAAILRITCVAILLKYRPSPPNTCRALRVHDRGYAYRGQEGGCWYFVISQACILAPPCRMHRT